MTEFLLRALRVAAPFGPPALFGCMVGSAIGLAVAAGAHASAAEVACLAAFLASVLGLVAWTLYTGSHSAPLAGLPKAVKADRDAGWPGFEQDFWAYMERSNDPPVDK